MNYDRKLLEWAWQAWRWLAGSVMTGYGSGVLSILQAWLLSRLISGVFLQGKDLQASLPELWGLLVIFAGRAVFGWLHEVSSTAAAVRVKNVFNHPFRLGLAYASAFVEALNEVVFREGHGMPFVRRLVVVADEAICCRDSETARRLDGAILLKKGLLCQGPYDRENSKRERQP